MPNYKVVDADVLDADLSAIGEAIRSKTGGTELLTLDEMPTAIEGIETGGGGDTSIEDGLITGTLTEYTNNRVESVRDYAFYYSNVTSVYLPKVKTLGNYAFCSSYLTTADFPLVETISSSCFGGASGGGSNNLTSVNFPNAIVVESSAFNFSRGLPFVDFPKVKEIKGTAFTNATGLKTVVLRSPILCSINRSNCFNSAVEKYLFPSALLEEYKTATNWSSIYASGKSVFLPLEEHTVDGTTTGEIDWDKLNGEVTA